MVPLNENAIKEKILYLIALAQEIRILSCFKQTNDIQGYLQDRKQKLRVILGQAHSGNWINRVDKTLFSASIFKSDDSVQKYIAEMRTPQYILPKELHSSENNQIYRSKIKETKNKTQHSDFSRKTKIQKTARILSLAYDIFTSYQVNKELSQSKIQLLIEYLNSVKNEKWISFIPDAIFTYSPFDQIEDIFKFFIPRKEEIFRRGNKPRFSIEFTDPPSSKEIDNRVISPSVDDFDSLKQPLQSGELLVFNFLNNNLPPDWEIYLQPSINGYKPDFVLLSKLRGIILIEVKDWNFNSKLKYYRKENKLYAQDRTTFKRFCVPDPLDRITKYRNNVVNLLAFSDDFGKRSRTFDQSGGRLDVDYCQYFVTERVIFTNSSNTGAKQLFDTRAVGLKDRLSLSHLLPEVFRKPETDQFPESVYLGIKTWLREPASNRDQRTFVSLDKRQQELALTRTKSGYRRIRGCAGSGKTIVLAKKAEDLCYKGKKVLYVSYNITMGHFARDLAYRFALCIEEGRADLFNENTEWKHFHGVLSDIFSVTGYERRDVEKMNKETKKRYFRHVLPESALEKLIAYEKKEQSRR